MMGRQKSPAESKPALILLGGHPGTGKSTVGQRLAQKKNAGLVDKDGAITIMAEQLLILLGCDKDDRESKTYVQKVKPLEYAMLLNIAYDNLDIGQSVVCAAPFTSQFRDPLYGLLDRKHHLLRWIIAGAAIVTALRLQPPVHAIDWIPVIGYAWGQGASTLRNVQMRIWLLPATALWLVFAAVTAVWPIVLLESMTFMINLYTIDRLTRIDSKLGLRGVTP